MTMQLVIEVLVLLAVLGAVAGVAAGFGDVLAPAPRDLAPLRLPTSGPVTAQDLEQVRFGVVFRGYRMAEVDDVLERLMVEIADRDDELAQLRARIDIHQNAGQPADEG